MATTPGPMEVDSRLQHLKLSCRIIQRSQYALGNGGFSEVFQGRCHIEGRGEITVAIKRLRFHVENVNFKRLFESEVYVWSKLKHPHILDLLGFVTCEDTGYPLLISEWMVNGTALSFVQNNPLLTLGDIVSFLRDVADGLSYLHGKGVVHSDIKSDNVVISSDQRAILCDLGCARMSVFTCSFAKITETPKGTSRYWAPELCRPGAKHCMETDVWAFGMTCYELFMRKSPFEGMAEPQIILLLASASLPTFSEPPVGYTNDTLLQDLCHRCWMPDPFLRPKTSQIFQELEAVATSLHRRERFAELHTKSRQARRSERVKSAFASLMHMYCSVRGLPSDRETSFDVDLDTGGMRDRLVLFRELLYVEHAWLRALNVISLDASDELLQQEKIVRSMEKVYREAMQVFPPKFEAHSRGEGQSTAAIQLMPTFLSSTDHPVANSFQADADMLSGRIHVPSAEMLLAAIADIIQMHEKYNGSLAGQPDTYHNLTSSEKAVFMTHFHAISENLEETDRYLATYLAATRNTAFVEYVVSMIELVDRQRLFLQMKDEDFIIDLSQLESLSVLSFYAREFAFLIVEYVQVWKQRKTEAIPQCHRASLHQVETDFLLRRSVQQPQVFVQQLPTPASSRRTTPSPDPAHGMFFNPPRKGQIDLGQINQPRGWSPRSSRSASMSTLASPFDCSMPPILEDEDDTDYEVESLRTSFAATDIHDNPTWESD